MRFRRDNPGESGAKTRDELRQLAEAVSLYRSAMRHVAEKQAERPFVPAQRKSAGLRMRLVLVPALCAALAAAVIGPAYMHLHHAAAIAGASVKTHASAPPAATQPGVDDTELMNQIDSEVSEDVPDALAPLADLSDQAVTATTNAEKKEHARQK
jgi:hypothetical protein